jgi:hypothetical protein
MPFTRARDRKVIAMVQDFITRAQWGSPDVPGCPERQRWQVTLLCRTTLTNAEIA